ncbi:hypothetical protein PV755_15395 [Streptomyces caniscabiei]|uniref:Uncharacterized protein n=1 Tax=Streptomyces caniscabiei TaxID=2746961 RepID=A0A927QGT0_9ACTN|nr:hypothetical protein [Streptomyces caniscabiei]MBD9725115.1 hypothetical protein [Streptomyces caniscabiei]MDX3510307.1 hypothetical protein [Streptomyces caniscabiei]MDX3720391.1 hypothetical protein [Streptomyces caniscabiei]WEO26305.1 hypothetical protein IHE65_25825 [Streptomyces caniscabiei]
MSNESSGESLGSRLRSHIGWLLGTLSAAVGILAFLLSRCEFTGPSFSDWKVKVNSICEQEFSALTKELYEAESAVATLIEEPAPTEDQIEAAMIKAVNFRTAMDHLVGKWRGAEQPEGRGEEIDKLHRAGTRVGEEYENMAHSISEYDLSQENFDAQNLALKNLATQFKSLDLNQCQPLVGEPGDWA